MRMKDLGRVLMPPEAPRALTLDEIYTPNERQREAHAKADAVTFCLFGGSCGCGKSTFIAAASLLHCLRFPGARVLLTRMEKTTFDRTTRPILMSLLPDTHVRRVTHDEIEFLNGSLLYLGMGLGGGRGESRLRSLNLSMFALDEASEFPLEIYQMLVSRLRLEMPGIHRSGILASNPSHNWLKTTFVTRALIDHAFVPALPQDNPALSQEYIDRCRRDLPALQFEAWFSGSWDFIESEDQLLTPEAVDESMARRLKAEGPRRIACDPARNGEAKTVILEKRGPVISILDVMSGRDDVVNIVDRICRYADQDASVPLLVDGCGLGGGVYDGLAHKGMRVFDVNGANKSSNPRWKNRRTEMFMRLQRELPNVQLPKSKELREQLLAIRVIVANERVQIEPKEDYSKRGIKSDLADCCAMLFDEQPAYNWAFFEPKSGPDTRPTPVIMREACEKEWHWNRIIK